jgi:lipopolysaccharide transport system permease protein
MTVGVVALSSSVAVRFRDVISVVPFLLSAALFLAPVGYPLSSLSHSLRVVLEFNPITGILEAFRWAMIAGYHPSVPAIGVSLVATAVILTVSWQLFTRLETTMADDI